MPQVEIKTGQTWVRHSGTLEVLAKTKKGYRVRVKWNVGAVFTDSVALWEIQQWAQNSLDGR